MHTCQMAHILSYNHRLTVALRWQLWNNVTILPALDQCRASTATNSGVLYWRSTGSVPCVPLPVPTVLASITPALAQYCYVCWDRTYILVRANPSTVKYVFAYNVAANTTYSVKGQTERKCHIATFSMTTIPWHHQLWLIALIHNVPTRAFKVMCVYKLVQTEKKCHSCSFRISI